MISPLAFIAALREIFPERYADHSGGCMKFHRLLKVVYLDANGYYNSDHVITEIDGDFYDIDGMVADLSNYLPLEEFGDEFLANAFPTVLEFDAADQIAQ